MSYQQINRFERFILGPRPEYKSLGEYRRIILVGEICFLIASFALIYLFIGLSFGYTVFLPLFIFFTGINVFIFMLNRWGKHMLAKIILLVIINIALYLFSSINKSNTGTYAFYFPLILLAFTFFDYSEIKLSILFGVISTLLFIFDLYSDFSFIPVNFLPGQYFNSVLILNFTISYLTSILLMINLVNTYHNSEASIIANQHQLNNLTRELKESEQRYELAVTGINAGLWDWDVKNNKIFHGMRWKEMLGYENDDMNISIDDFYPLVHPEDVENVRNALNEHFKNRVPYNIEYRIRKKDNSYAWFYDAGKALYDDEGNPVRMVGSIINISKRKENEEWIRQQNDLLEKTNAELDRFVYITSHDLKAPLLSVQGLINLAEMSASKAEVDLCLKMMKDRITGLETFIADIINYSRNVRVGLVKENIDIQKTVNNIINEFLFMKNVDRIHFDVSIDKDLHFISDDKRFSVIMKNLISNAIKYHNYDQSSPEIKISAHQNEDHLVISVKDNGEGIDPEMQPRIFEMFFRGSEKSTGSGLGLYIVHEMLEKINGRINVNSNQGAGTEFILTLPLTL